MLALFTREKDKPIVKELQDIERIATAQDEIDRILKDAGHHYDGRDIPTPDPRLYVYPRRF